MAKATRSFDVVSRQLRERGRRIRRNLAALKADMKRSERKRLAAQPKIEARQRKRRELTESARAALEGLGSRSVLTGADVKRVLRPLFRIWLAR